MTVEVIGMNSRDRMAEELIRKEERVNAWERNNSEIYYEEPSIEYWHIDG